MKPIPSERRFICIRGYSDALLLKLTGWETSVVDAECTPVQINRFCYPLMIAHKPVDSYLK